MVNVEEGLFIKYIFFVRVMDLWDFYKRGFVMVSMCFLLRLGIDRVYNFFIYLKILLMGICIFFIFKLFGFVLIIIDMDE